MSFTLDNSRRLKLFGQLRSSFQLRLFLSTPLRQRHILRQAVLPTFFFTSRKCGRLLTTLLPSRGELPLLLLLPHLPTLCFIHTVFTYADSPHTLERNNECILYSTWVFGNSVLVNKYSIWRMRIIIHIYVLLYWVCIHTHKHTCYILCMHIFFFHFSLSHTHSCTSISQIYISISHFYTSIYTVYT